MTGKKKNIEKKPAFAILFDTKLQLLLRIVIGFLLIYFSLSKFADPVQWAEVIYQYRLVPFGLVNIASILFSWLEFFAGLGILLGIFTRASALIGAGVVGLFLAALQINIFREVYIYCTCFRKQAYLTDVTYSNRNITFFVLILLILIFLNRSPKAGVDSFIEKRKQTNS